MIRSGAFLGLLLLLGGCSGFGGFLGSTFSPSGDPDRPIGTAENIQRANGAPVVSVTPITTQPGDVWPGQIKPLPSIADIAKTMPETGEIPTTLPPMPGNLTPPAPLPQRFPAPAVAPPGAAQPAPGAPSTTGAPQASQFQPSVNIGTTITTSRGPEKISGGTGNFLTLTTSGGQYGGILVPNGNGTSTIIRPDGSVETVKTPH